MATVTPSLPPLEPSAKQSTSEPALEGEVLPAKYLPTWGQRESEAVSTRCDSWRRGGQVGGLGATGLASHSPCQRTARNKAHKETQNRYQQKSYFPVHLLTGVSTKLWWNQMRRTVWLVHLTIANVPFVFIHQGFRVPTLCPGDTALEKHQNSTCVQGARQVSKQDDFRPCSYSEGNNWVIWQ